MQSEYKNKFKEHLGVTTDGKPLKIKLFEGDVVQGVNDADETCSHTIMDLSVGNV